MTPTTTHADVDGFDAPSARTLRHAVMSFDRASAPTRVLPEALPPGRNYGSWRSVLDVQFVRPGAWHVRVGTYTKVPPPLPPYAGKAYLAGPSDVATYLYAAGEVSVVTET